MKKHILIAEDDAFLTKMYTLELQDAAYEIEIASNGKKAIESITKAQPDLLLLDLMMPEMNGFEVLRLIKEKGYTFPVVVLSSLSQEIDKEKCKELGARDYFVKSDMALEQLTELIKKYV